MSAKISQLPSVTLPLSGTELVPVVQGGVNKKATAADLDPNTYIPPSGTALLGKLIGADFNTTADQVITLSGGTTYFISSCIVTNASVDLNTADNGKLFTGPGQTGDGAQIFAVGGLSVPRNVDQTYQSPIQNPPGSGQAATVTGSTLYFSLGTPQGSAATADIYLFGMVLA